MMSNNQGFAFRSSSVSNMSAFKPFVPDVIPQQQQQQQQQYHHHNRHQRHYSHQQNPCGQAAVGSGGVFQPIAQSSSYCGSASTLPRGQSPDNGYLSLEHPSRTASFVSQMSMQFSPSAGDLTRNNCGPYDPAFPKEIHSPGGRLQQPPDSNSDSPSSATVGYRCSQSSVNSSTFNSPWTSSKKSGPGFDFRCTPGRRQGLEEDRHNMYSTVGGGYRNSGNSLGSEARQPATSTGGPPSSSELPKDVALLSDLKNTLLLKETELRMMRETMTKNESAILQVFEDKKRKWQMEMTDRKKEWEGQLQAQQKKAWKTEQLLQFQVAKLHQENRKLQTRADELESEKKRLEDQCRGLEAELNNLKSDMRGLLDDVTTKDLISQFQSYKIDADRYKIDPDYHKVAHSPPNNNLNYPTQQNTAETGNVGSGRQMRRKHPLQETLHCLNRTSSELSLAKTDVRTLSLPELQRALEDARREVETCRAEFEQERQSWKAEKEKVIDYQKRLQLSYLQILHKNRLLELDVQQLTGEMAELDIRQLSKDEAVSKTSQGETVY